MTGYGKADYEDGWMRVSAEVKSINAKHADVSLHLPKVFVAQEIAWRNLAIAQLERGKITLAVSYALKDTTLPSIQINQALFTNYYSMLQALAQEVGAPLHGLFQVALQFPGVTASVEHENDTAPEEDEKLVEKVIQEALQQCDQSRKIEGEALTTQLKACLQAIKESLEAIQKLDPERVKAIREKLHAGVTTLATSYSIDENRLEQELLYYVERLDVTEEKVRLARHLTYFEEVMENCQAKGKKLGFIAQEIGREINTLGAKANDAAIQREVILMKEEVEKIKEQLQNIL